LIYGKQGLVNSRKIVSISLTNKQSDIEYVVENVKCTTRILNDTTIIIANRMMRTRLRNSVLL